MGCFICVKIKELNNNNKIKIIKISENSLLKY